MLPLADVTVHLGLGDLDAMFDCMNEACGARQSRLCCCLIILGQGATCYDSCRYTSQPRYCLNASVRVAADFDAFIAAWCSNPLRQMNRINFWSPGTSTTAREPNVWERVVGEPPFRHIRHDSAVPVIGRHTREGDVTAGGRPAGKRPVGVLLAECAAENRAVAPCRQLCRQTTRAASLAALSA